MPSHVLIMYNPDVMFLALTCVCGDVCRGLSREQNLVIQTDLRKWNIAMNFTKSLQKNCGPNQTFKQSATFIKKKSSLLTD